MHKNSIYSTNIKIDFEKSHDSYIYDKNRGEYFLDFHGLYASLPLGYNHKIFKNKDYQKTIERISKVKIPNNVIMSDEAQEFFQCFSRHQGMSNYKHFHFSCTGALAIEAAIKAAIDHKKSKRPKVLSLKESFHGVNSYGGFVTDRFYPTSLRLEGFPTMPGWEKLHNPKIIYEDNKISEKKTSEGLKLFKEDFQRCLKKYGSENIVALVVEPIQCTFGDNYFPPVFFELVRKLCNQHNIVWIQDEIQTGFGGTGKLWYYQYFKVEPDIIAFGKKTQLSGVMAKPQIKEIFEKSLRLEVTWDGDLIDMVRCKYILKGYDKYNILDNVNKQGQKLAGGLRKIAKIKNVRQKGLLLAFDFDTSEERDAFYKTAYKNRLLVSKTNVKSVRLRPNLNLSDKECEQGLKLIEKSVRNI